MLLRFGHVFSITILAPDPEGICLENVFRSPTIQKYENIYGLEIQEIKDYASKEGDWAKSKQGRIVRLTLVDAII